MVAEPVPGPGELIPFAPHGTPFARRPRIAGSPSRHPKRQPWAERQRERAKAGAGLPAPQPDCKCDICHWCFHPATYAWPKRLIRPTDPQWQSLIWLAQDATRNGSDASR